MSSWRAGQDKVACKHRPKRRLLTQVRKRGSVRIAQAFEVVVDRSIPSNWFFEWEPDPCIDKPIVVTEPAVQSARLWGLGSKLYSGNKHRMLNNDLDSISLSQIRQKSRKRNKGSASRATLALSVPCIPFLFCFHFLHIFSFLVLVFRSMFLVLVTSKILACRSENKEPWRVLSCNIF